MTWEPKNKTDDDDDAMVSDDEKDKDDMDSDKTRDLKGKCQFFIFVLFAYLKKVQNCSFKPKTF